MTTLNMCSHTREPPGTDALSEEPTVATHEVSGFRGRTNSLVKEEFVVPLVR